MRKVRRCTRLSLALALAAVAPAAAEVVTISPADFQATWTNPFRYDSYFDPAAGFRRALAGAACAVAPLQLPNQAVIQSMVVWARDDNATFDLEATLLRIGNLGAPGQDVVIVSTGGSSSSIVPLIGLPGVGKDTTVDKATESWWIMVCFEDDVALELHNVYLNYQGRPSGVDTTDPVVVPASALRTESGVGTSYDYFKGFAEGSDVGVDGCVLAPVYLPSGATVKSLQADVWDGSSVGNLELQLRRKRLSTSEAPQIVATVATSGIGFSVIHLNTNVISNALVSSDYQYFLTSVAGCLEAGEDLRIYSVRIGHDDPVFRDGFESGNTTLWDFPQSVLVVPPAAFVSAPADFTADSNVVGTSGILQLDDQCAVAPISLPNGAEIFAVTSYLRDGDASRNLTLRLRRKRSSTAAVTELVALTTAGSSANPQVDALFLSEVVDNDSYHYYVDACAPDGASAGSFAIHGVKVSYYLP